MILVISTLLTALAAAAGAAQAPDASGRWDLLVNAPDGPHRPQLTLAKSGDTLSGTITEAGRDYKIAGTQKGANLSISFAFPAGDGPIQITLTGVQQGDSIDGQAAFDDDKGTWSAKRAAAAPGGSTAGPAAADIDLSGAWAFEVTSPAGTGSPTITFKQQGSNLTGQYVGQLGEAPVTGTLKGAEVAFGFDIAVQEVKLHVLYTGTAAKDSMKGTVSFGDLGEGTFTAQRK